MASGISGVTVQALQDMFAAEFPNWSAGVMVGSSPQGMPVHVRLMSKGNWLVEAEAEIVKESDLDALIDTLKRDIIASAGLEL